MRGFVVKLHDGVRSGVGEYQMHTTCPGGHDVGNPVGDCQVGCVLHNDALLHAASMQVGEWRVQEVGVLRCCQCVGCRCGAHVITVRRTGSIPIGWNYLSSVSAARAPRYDARVMSGQQRVTDRLGRGISALKPGVAQLQSNSCTRDSARPGGGA